MQNDPDKIVQSNAAWALGEINPLPSYVYNALRDALNESSDSNIRAYSAQALGSNKHKDPP